MAKVDEDRYEVVQTYWDGVWESGNKWSVVYHGATIKEYSVYNPLAHVLAKFYAWRHNL